MKQNEKLWSHWPFYESNRNKRTRHCFRLEKNAENKVKKRGGGHLMNMYAAKNANIVYMLKGRKWAPYLFQQKVLCFQAEWSC